MKSYLTPLLFTVASLTAISANAGAPSYFIPTEPTVTAPADQASNVSLTPEFTSSDFQFTEGNESDNDPTLSKSNWIVSKKSDNITIIGSSRASNNNSSNFNFEYDIPFDITISGQTAVKLKVEISTGDGTQYQLIKLLAENHNTIALTHLALDGFRFQPNKSFVITKTTANTLQLQLHLINGEATEIIAEYILLDRGLENQVAKDDVFGWRTTPNELTNTLFSSTDSSASCSVAESNIASIDTNIGIPEHDGASTAPFSSLNEWKVLLEENNFDKFLIACKSQPTETPNESKIVVTAFTSADITNFLPQITDFSTDSESYTLSDAEQLSPNTAYNVQTQHIAILEDKTAVSNWSDSISFTTRAADTIYQVTAPTDLAFTTGVAKDLAFKISNTGSEAGAPQVTIRLPFEVLSALNGTLSDFFNVSVGGKNCAMNQSGGKTDFVCQLDSLAAAAEVELAAKVTVQDTAISKIEYQVCDTAKCAATAFTAVDITVTAAPTDPAPEASSSSSSGGSMFWLFLMAPLLLVRRK
jgi:hypothetical protein